MLPLSQKTIVMAKKGRTKIVPSQSAKPIPSSKEDSLAQIERDLENCKRCKLSKSRTHIVIGSGNPKARLMLVGEAPGEQEDLDGVPFVGRSGQLLIKMVEAMGLSREEVFIANVAKCRPPENRNPEVDEINACEPFLFRQIAAIRPQVVVALGKFASQTLLKTETPISELRGKFKTANLGCEVLVMPTFHPAYLLRSPSSKKDAWEDLKAVAKKLGLKIKETK